VVVEPQELILRDVAEDGRADVLDEPLEPLAAAVVVGDDLEEVGLGGELGVTARGPEDRVE
jgi:hypothetical protein